MFGGKPLTLIELAQDGQVELAISDDILDETLRVLRDKFQQTPEQLQETEVFIGAITRRVTPTETIEVVKSDASDNRVLECAVAAGSDVIVTGDAHLLQLGTYQAVKIMKPADFLDRGRGRLHPPTL